MTSDKSFTMEEFKEALPKFGQALADKSPGSRVEIKNDPIDRMAYIVSISNNGKSQNTQLKLNRDGTVSMTNIFGQI